MTGELSCPHCLHGQIHETYCEQCGAELDIRGTVPSFTDIQTGDPDEKKLAILTEIASESLDAATRAVRDDYMDGSVVDRFFKTRTVNWRVLIAPHLSGRGLLLGDHEPKVGILLSELLDEVYIVDSSVARLQAQTAIANACDTSVKPLHGDIGELPFPADAFDVIAIDCRAHEIGEYLSQAKRHIATGGKVLLLVDGWPRESGLTDVFGLGEPSNGLSKRVHASLSGHSLGIRRRVCNAGFALNEGYALLSTNRHENERSFNVDSRAAIDWLLRGSPKTAKGGSFILARMLSKLAAEAGVLQQCFPRYLFVCQLQGEGQQEAQVSFTESVLISGKNRSTVLEFDDGQVGAIRKVPNSRWQATLNENAGAVTNAVKGEVSETVPRGELIETKFGAERHEEPVEGTPLDKALELTAESIDHHVGIVFDWLANFQTANKLKCVEKDPAMIERELTIESVGVSSPPPVEEPVEIPLVISHGDFFGSNIYLEDDEVMSVIDWEWAEREANPIVDAGFFLLQLANYVSDDFEQGFEQLFVEDGEYSNVVNHRIETYCERVGIQRKTFWIYLPISYINRIKKDLTFNKRLDFDWPARVAYIFNNSTSIEHIPNHDKPPKEIRP